MRVKLKLKAYFIFGGCGKIGFVNVYFPQPKAHFYFELGTDDSRANITDLKAHWDHAIGYILGFKKYGIMGNKSLFIGLEVISTKPKFL